MTSPEKRRRNARIATAVCAAYLATLLVATAYVRWKLWDMRALEQNLLDSAWQLELAWRARHGQWSGRDFAYPMGPAWQVVAWLGSLPGAFSPARTQAGLELLFRLLGTVAAAFIAWHTVRGPWRRLAAWLLITDAGFRRGSRHLPVGSEPGARRRLRTPAR